MGFTYGVIGSTESCFVYEVDGAWSKFVVMNIRPTSWNTQKIVTVIDIDGEGIYSNRYDDTDVNCVVEVGKLGTVTIVDEEWGYTVMVDFI